MDKKKVAVIGAGSWATALVKIVCENLDTVNWLVRNDFYVEHIKAKGNNPRYLSSVEFNPSKLNLSSDINYIIKNSEIIIIATPSAYLLDVLKNLEESMENKIVFCSVKGIINEYGISAGELLEKKYKVELRNLGVIAGPCHAEEVASERLSYLTVASYTEKYAQDMADILASDYIKTSIAKDVFGIEYSAILKNIFSVCVGICHGLGYGDNFIAVVMANAAREIELFLNTVIPGERNINHSVYLGDLLVTGYSVFSRNRMFGTMIGKGYTVKSAILEMDMVSEGYYATKGINSIIEKYELDMPICKTVYNILYEDKRPKKQINKLADLLK